MSLTTLGLALALQVASSHAALHPADVDIFLEVPDVPALVRTYEGVPLVRLLHDEEIARAIGAVMRRQGGVDPAAQLALLYETEVPAEVRQMLRSLRAVSVSLRVPGAPIADSISAAPGPLPALACIVDFAGEEAARAALAALAGLAASAEPYPDSPLPGALRLEFAELSGLPAWAAADGARVLLGAGALDPAELAPRAGSAGGPGGTGGAATGEGGLAGRAGYRDAGRAFAASAGTTVVAGFSARSPLEMLAAAPLPDEVRTGLGPALAEFPGLLGGVRRWRMELVGDRFVTEMMTLEGDEEGASPPVLGGRPLDRAWLVPVAPEAMFAYSSALDGAALLAGVRNLLARRAAAAGEELDLAALEGELGVSLEALFAGIGPGFVVYANAPGGLALPEMYAWIELADPGAFQAGLAALGGTLGQRFPGFGLETRDYRVKDPATGERIAFPITTLGFPPELLAESPVPIAIAPSLTVTGGKLLVSPSSMHLKRELKRLYGGDEKAAAAVPGEAAGGAGGAAGTTGTPATTRTRHPWEMELAAETRSLLVMDWGQLLGGLLATAKALGGMFSLPFDVQALPSPEVFGRYFAPTVHVSRRVDGGTYRRHEASFGPEVAGGALLAVFFAFEPHAAMAAPMAAPMEITWEDSPPGEALPPPGGDDAHLATEHALQVVRMGLAVYQLDQKVHPASLAVLIQPTGAFPNGFLDPPEVPVDGWGRELRYEPAADGSTYRLWSVGPDGIDEGGAGDDVVAQ
ncbi:MAG: type II secretion system protein GspG [Planctomycetota bacterium]